jgi:hypothetical protein
MCNHPSRGYPASMKLLEKFKDISPLRDFVTHRFKVEDAAAAMAQVQDLNACIAADPIPALPPVFKTGRQTLQINCRFSLCQSSGLAVVFASCSACFSLIVVGGRMV